MNAVNKGPRRDGSVGRAGWRGATSPPAGAAEALTRGGAEVHRPIARTLTSHSYLLALLEGKGTAIFGAHLRRRRLQLEKDA